MGVRTDTRARMIASAALLLREHGVAHTSIAKVLEHSNGPRGSVAFHFPGGKTELISEALLWAGNTVTDAMRKKNAEGATAAEVFTYLCERYKQNLERSEYLAGCPVGAAAQDSHADPTIGPIVAQVMDSWTEALTETMVEAGRDRDDAVGLATLCVCGLEGAILLARIKRSSAPVDAVRDRLSTLL